MNYPAHSESPLKWTKISGSPLQRTFAIRLGIHPQAEDESQAPLDPAR
jgi:hypothetical protein